MDFLGFRASQPTGKVAEINDLRKFRGRAAPPEGGKPSGLGPCFTRLQLGAQQAACPFDGAKMRFDQSEPTGSEAQLRKTISKYAVRLIRNW
jgi:hypothetical protein